ncbi:radical SAM protein [Candidatus Dependentiae bacterium]|nr:radical SAM protein [Candidatus Dependentiae bacterium]
MNRKYNVLFVYPAVAKKGEYYAFPLGIAYVYAYAEQNNISCYSLNLNHCENPETALSDSIKKNNIDVVASGTISFFWKEIEYVFQTVKKIKPDIITIAGGSIITSTPELALKNLPVDYGVLGEGEITFTELVNALNNGVELENVNGIIYRDSSGKLKKTSERKPIMNLDELPFPDYSAFDFEKWLDIDWVLQPSIKGIYYDYNQVKRLAEIIGSRSCPFACTFCYHPLGKIYRQRSVENIFYEIDMLIKKYDINLLNFLDELFSLDKQRIEDISVKISKYGIKWMAQWRVNEVTEDIMDKIKKSNVFLIGLGVESLDDTVLKSMKKKITREQIITALSIAEKAGVRTGSNLIFGDVEETESSAYFSLNWMLKQKQYDFALDFIMAIPDSDLYKFANEKEIIKNELNHIKERFPIINLSKIPNKKFEKLKRKVAFLNITLNHKVSAEVVKSIKTEETYLNRQIYSFDVKCPLCGKVSNYKFYMFSKKPVTPVLCKYCYKVLKIKTGAVFYEEYNFIKAYLFLFLLLLYHLYLYKMQFFKKIFVYIKKKNK